MAQSNGDAFAELIAHVETENEAVRSLLDTMLQEPELPGGQAGDGPPPEVAIPEAFQVVVECGDESEQQAVYQRLSDEGLKCRVLTL